MASAHVDRRCLNCGYDLRASRSASDCPECGQVVVLSLLRADRNRLGRDDWVWTTIAALRTALLLHGAMLIFAMTFAFPGWLSLPISMPITGADAVIATAVVWTGWVVFVAWIAMLWWTREDAGRASISWWAMLVLVPLMDCIVRTFAIDEWNSFAPVFWIRVAAMLTPLFSATVLCLAVHRLMAPLPAVPRGTTLLRVAYAGLVLLTLVGVVTDFFGLAVLGVGGTLTGGEGLALFAQAMFISAYSRRLRVVGRAIGARGDVTIIPSFWECVRDRDRAPHDDQPRSAEFATDR